MSIDHDRARRIADGWASFQGVYQDSPDAKAGALARAYLGMPDVDHVAAFELAEQCSRWEGDYPPAAILARAYLDRQEPHHRALREMRATRKAGG